MFSFREAERRGIEIPSSGGNDWSHDADRIKEVDEYVHLAFVDDHPMLFLAKKEHKYQNPFGLKLIHLYCLEMMFDLVLMFPTKLE